LNIEHEFFGEYRLKKLAELMDWSVHETIGRLSCLWKESQAHLAVSGDGNDLLDWAWFTEKEKPELGKKFLKAILNTNFVSKKGKKYVIHGNERHVEVYKRLLRQSRKGGETTKKKWGPKGYPEGRLKGQPKGQPSTNAERPASQQGPMQGNTMQGNTVTKSTNVLSSIRPEVDLIKIWNDNCQHLPKVVKANDSRKRKIKARLRENPDPAYWEKTVERITDSKFANGSTGQWSATFDWLIANDSNHAKINEGNYDDRKKNSNLNYDVSILD
jgi:hypothetical protein